MTRWARACAAGALVLALDSAGCGGEPCAGYAGSCVALRVEGAAPPLTSLEVRVSLAGVPWARGSAGREVPFSLPIETALRLEHLEGAVGVALSSGAWAGQGQVTLPRDAHVPLTVTLAEPPPPDAGVDASEDTGPALDLGVLPGVDLLGVAPRRVYVTSSTVPAVIDRASVCAASTRDEVTFPKGTFVPLLGIPGEVLALSLKLTPSRPVVDMNGLQITTDEALFSGVHFAAVDVDGFGKRTDASCVFTGFELDFVGRATADRTCNGWSGLFDARAGLARTGLNQAADQRWAVSWELPCEATTCRVYCIETF